MKKNKAQYMAVYCQRCGCIDYNVSVIAIETIRRIAQTEDAIIDCKQCGAKITVNFTNDILKINKRGKIKLNDTTQW